MDKLFNLVLLVIDIYNDEAINPTSESHDSIARMNYLHKRKKEET